MGKTIISDAVIDRLATSLETYFSGSRAYSSQSVLYIKASSEKMMGGIENAKEETSVPMDYNVLVEYPTAQDGTKFILHGNDFVCMLLAERFGGRISNCRYWIMYNEPITDYNHGYKEKLPTGEEIINYLKETLKPRA